jgi:hypothetical protein
MQQVLSFSDWKKTSVPATFHNSRERASATTNSFQSVADMGPKGGVCGLYRPQWTTLDANRVFSRSLKVSPACFAGRTFTMLADIAQMSPQVSSFFLSFADSTSLPAAKNPLMTVKRTLTRRSPAKIWNMPPNMLKGMKTVGMKPKPP